MDSELSEDYLETIPKAMRTIRMEMRRHRDSDLTMPQFRILAQLWQGPCNNKCLAEQIGVSVAAISRMVQGLVSRDLILRLPSQGDRREVLLGLSKEGIKTFQNIRKKARFRIGDQLKKLSAKEKQALKSGLEVLQKLHQL
jgi:DNA-binding MarR family transcriptional regulator